MISKTLRAAVAKGYHIDENGNVHGPTGRVVRTFRSSGFLAFNIKLNGQVRQVYVHRLVALQKYGRSAATGYVVFVDGDRTNCAADNISLKPRSVPARIKKDVRERYHKFAQSVRTIGEVHSLNPGSVHRIIHGR